MLIVALQLLLAHIRRITCVGLSLLRSIGQLLHIAKFSNPPRSQQRVIQLLYPRLRLARDPQTEG